METTASVSITRDGSVLKAVADALLKTIKATLEGGLKCTVKTSTTETTQTTVKRTVNYRGGPELLFAEYVLVDRYTLRRTDGTVVQAPWEVKNADIFRQVVFPPQAAAKVVVQSSNVHERTSAGREATSVSR